MLEIISAIIQHVHILYVRIVRIGNERVRTHTYWTKQTIPLVCRRPNNKCNMSVRGWCTRGWGWVSVEICLAVGQLWPTQCRHQNRSNNLGQFVLHSVSSPDHCARRDNEEHISGRNGVIWHAEIIYGDKRSLMTPQFFNFVCVCMYVCTLLELYPVLVGRYSNCTPFGD